MSAPVARTRHVPPFEFRVPARSSAVARVTGSIIADVGIPGVDEASFCFALSTGAIAAVATVMLDFATRAPPPPPKRARRSRRGTDDEGETLPRSDALRALVGTFAIVTTSALVVSALHERSRRSDVRRAFGAP